MKFKVSISQNSYSCRDFELLLWTHKNTWRVLHILISYFKKTLNSLLNKAPWIATGSTAGVEGRTFVSDRHNSGKFFLHSFVKSKNCRLHCLCSVSIYGGTRGQSVLLSPPCWGLQWGAHILVTENVESRTWGQVSKAVRLCLCSPHSTLDLA